MTQLPLAVSKLFAHRIMDTSFPPSYSLNLDLYEEEESTLCCVKITKFYRKNQPFIYEFKDTEGNNYEKIGALAGVANHDFRLTGIPISFQMVIKW